MEGRGRHQGRGRESGGVHLSVDLATLAGLSESPGELSGYGPVVADLARQMARAQAGGAWSYAITDPQGRTLHQGMTRRRPTAAVARAVRALHPTCGFPGCRIPARDCDLDHTRPWVEGGATTSANLAPLCRPDHLIRHRFGWSYVILANGDLLWTSRLGHHYTTSGRPP